MLHEVLLALSGHPSPIFDRGEDAPNFPLASDAETALLSNLSRLASIHRALKTHLRQIVDDHESTLCRVVANSILYTHLAQFQQTIVDVERDILTKDTSHVGAYNIVPLASIVARFEQWKRKLEWYWELACFMKPTELDVSSNNGGLTSSEYGCDGVALLGRIRQAMQTGYPDIEEAATQLAHVAEIAWIRLLCTWLMLGKSPEKAERDFFVHSSDTGKGTSQSLTIKTNLIPTFVTEETAVSILNIGKISNYMKSNSFAQRPTSKAEQSSKPLPTREESTFVIQPDQITGLTQLKTPISSAVLASELAAIRAAISSKFAAELLPSSWIIRTLSMFRQFYLGGRDDYADTLVQEADKYLQTRHLQTQIASKKDSEHNLAGLMLKKNELQSILARTWATMASSVGKGETIDEELEWAREHILLKLAEQHPSTELVQDDNNESDAFELSSSMQDMFSEFLLANPISFPPQLDPAFGLIISAGDIQAYEVVNSYLIALRRAHCHLAELWMRGPLRRAPPRHFNPARKQGPRSFNPSQALRRKETIRETSMRPAWAAASSAIFLVDEMGDYFTAEVIENAWRTFRSWASKMNEQSRPSSAETAREEGTDRPHLSNFQNSFFSNSAGSRQGFSSRYGSAGERFSPDPEILALAHRQYVTALVEDLLLTNTRFVQAVKTFLQRIDLFVALIDRLTRIQRDLDLREEGVVEDFSRNFAEDEKDVFAQVIQTAKVVHDDMRNVISVLKELSNSDRVRNTFDQSSTKKTEFSPWRTSGVERLLIRLDFGVID